MSIRDNLGSKTSAKIIEDGTETKIEDLLINKFDSEEDYKSALKRGEISENEFYSFPAKDPDSVLDAESDNAVKNKVVTAEFNKINSNLSQLTSVTSLNYSNTSIKKGVIQFAKTGRLVQVFCPGDFISLPHGGYTDYVTDLDDSILPANSHFTFTCANNQNILVLVFRDTKKVCFYNYGDAITSDSNGSCCGTYISKQ